MSHDLTIKTLDITGEVELKCSCGWQSTATDSTFAKAIKERHETLNNIKTKDS